MLFLFLGNHESVPVCSFPPIGDDENMIGEKYSNRWVYNLVADVLGQDLPPEAIRTLRYGGYYMMQIKPGFRLLNINTNFCDRLNLWNLYKPIDIGGQLKWLADQLYAAEQAGDRVHIHGHIPPDNHHCNQAWLYNYVRIVQRFNQTILAQYFGHTHQDEFRVYYWPLKMSGDSGGGISTSKHVSSKDNPTPISVAYIGGSISNYIDNNSNYRLYHIDRENFVMKNYETFYFNLTEANIDEHGKPNWKLCYKAVEAFDLPDMSAQSWHNFLTKLHNDENDLFDQFRNLYYRNSDRQWNVTCRGKCKSNMLNVFQIKKI